MKQFLKIPVWLFFVLLGTFVLRIPSFFEPYSYGDEMIYLTLGEGVRQGLTLYKDVHDNKPPLLYLTAALAGNLFFFKTILAFWHLATIFLFWKLTQIFFSKKKAHVIATILFSIFTTIPLLEGTIVNAELFMIGPTILGFYLLLMKNPSLKSFFYAGLLFSISTLFKVPALFEVPAIIFFLLFVRKKIPPSYTTLFKGFLVLGFGFILPILYSFGWYFLKGALNEYIGAAFLQNVGYISAWRPSDHEKPFIIKNAPLLIRGGIVLIGIIVLGVYRKRLSNVFIFSTLWLLFGLFGVTLPERPYPHYLIQVVAPAAILFTILFTSEKKEQVYTIMPLCLLFFVPVYFQFWHYQTIPYYTRFVRYTSNQIEEQDYLKSFGGEVPSTYMFAKILKAYTKEHDQVMIWGDRPALYALSKRLPPIQYVAGYHINDFTSYEIISERLFESKPKAIVVLKESPETASFQSLLSDFYYEAETLLEGKLFIRKN